jgi:hypothetical protein
LFDILRFAVFCGSPSSSHPGHDRSSRHVGTKEFAMRKLGYLVLVLCLLPAALSVLAQNPPKKPANEQRELLSSHVTLAVFDGVNFRLCRGRTALCPERCGDSGEFASFTVKKYLKYEKLGQYGDPEQQNFLVQVSDFNRKPKGDPKILETVKGLEKGDHVLLSWNHDYVTKQGTSSPERPIVKLEKIDADRAAKLLKAVEVN